MVFCCVGLFMIVLLWLLKCAWFVCGWLMLLYWLHGVVTSLFFVWWFCGVTGLLFVVLRDGLLGLGLWLCYVGLLDLCLKLCC